MIYVTINITKLNHFSATISSNGKIFNEAFEFSNGFDDFHMLLSRLDSLVYNSLIIGLESTAHYADNLVRFLITRDINVSVLNLIKTSTMRKNEISKTRTDIVR